MKKIEEKVAVKLKKNIDKVDLMKMYPSLYKAKEGVIDEVVLPELAYLNFIGTGDPAGEDFQLGIQALYSTAFSIKFIYKEVDADFSIPALQCTWFVENYYEHMNDRDSWRWCLSVPLPKHVTEKQFQQSLKNLKDARKYTELHNKVEFEHKPMGKAIQTMHIGAYDNEHDELVKLVNYAKEKGIEIIPNPQEIYISDPRKTEVNKLKTILRYNCK